MKKRYVQVRLAKNATKYQGAVAKQIKTLKRTKSKTKNIGGFKTPIMLA